MTEPRLEPGPVPNRRQRGLFSAGLLVFDAVDDAVGLVAQLVRARR